MTFPDVAAFGYYSLGGVRGSDGGMLESNATSGDGGVHLMISSVQNGDPQLVKPGYNIRLIIMVLINVRQYRLALVQARIGQYHLLQNPLMHPDADGQLELRLRFRSARPG